MESSLQTTTISYEFSQPLIQQNDVYTSILITEATGYQNIPGEPIVPVVMRTVEIPFGASIKETRCVLTTDRERELPQKITPAARPVPAMIDHLIVPSSETSETYTKNQLYPDAWYSYRLTGGLNKQNILTTFLTIQINPVRYNPIQNIIQSIASITIEVTYEQPTHPFSPCTDSYDMIIICKDSYASLLEPLVTHKNNHGIQTKLIPLSISAQKPISPWKAGTKQSR